MFSFYIIEACFHCQFHNFFMSLEKCALQLDMLFSNNSSLGS